MLIIYQDLRKYDDNQALIEIIYGTNNLYDDVKNLYTKEFKQLKRDLYRKLHDGFYVFSPPSKFKTIDRLIKYVTRYVARPVIAKSRIIDYDGIYVTFWYQRHEDNKIVIEKIHTFEFISRIILHIPEKKSKIH